MKFNLKKRMLAAVITLSTASIYYAQQSDTLAKSKDIEQVVLTGVADIAKERKTPVAVSTIKEAQIVQKLGNQEFPEILSTTPSIYATKGGGGFGDGRMNVRGFDTSNTAVMINGVPVNDMEGGTVYWSNWLGLSDVTSAMQVQRGLGASKLAIASVGGTVNIITRSADKKQEGNVTVGVGNNGYLKSLFSYNTGLSKAGWSSSFLMARTAGATYINGSDFEAYNYYFALGYKPNAQHDLQFTFTGAPQWHMQNYQSTISTFLDMGDGRLDKVYADAPNRKYNPNWGYLHGDKYSQTVNYYSKPVASLNWDWKMSDRSKLATVLYASWGRGGGTGILGSINGQNSNAATMKDINGLIRFDDIYAWNQGQKVNWVPPTAAAPNPAQNKINATPGSASVTNGMVRRANVNSHDWYGILTSFNHKINDELSFSAGFDGRYYYGYHPGIVTDFLGNSRYLEKGDQNQPAGYYVTMAQKAAPSANPFDKAVKDNSQIVNRNYDGKVLWGGVFGQLEYTRNAFSAFFQGSFSDQGFQRIDHWIVDGVTKQQGQVVNTKTVTKYITGYNVKGGANYNIDEHNNVFANVGYYSKQPNNYGVWGNNNQQVLNPYLTNEKIFGAEVGYGFKSKAFTANLNLYRTDWKDRFQRITNLSITDQSGTQFTGGYINMQGVRELHSGIEFEGNARVMDMLSVNLMFSYGDWKYKGDAQGNIYDANNAEVKIANNSNAVTLALDNVKVADAAQTTAAIGVDFRPVKGVSIFPTWRYAQRLYGLFTIDKNYVYELNGGKPTAKGSLEYPSFNLFDLGASFTINLNDKQRFIITGNVYNLFDTTYISDGRSSNFTKQLTDFKDSATAGTAQAQYDAYQKTLYKGLDPSNQVYFGFGRTWAASISFRF